MSDDHACPSCGGAGGGPFGRPGSAWDVESYVCVRCRGLGVVTSAIASARPLAKTTAEATPADDRGVGAELAEVTERPGLAGTRPPSVRPARRASS